MTDARAAIYYAPTADDPLFAASTIWLGRNPETNAPAPQPALPGIAEITEDARQYGFHATLKPPLRLPPGRRWDDLLEAATTLARSLKPFDLPPLADQERVVPY